MKTPKTNRRDFLTISLGLTASFYLIPKTKPTFIFGEPRTELDEVLSQLATLYRDETNETRVHILEHLTFYDKKWTQEKESKLSHLAGEFILFLTQNFGGTK